MTAKKKTAKKKTPQFNRKKYLERVEEILQNRYARHTLVSEADFLAGAGVVFDILDRMDEFPASWVFCPMLNQSVLDEEQLPKEEYERANKTS